VEIKNIFLKDLGISMFDNYSLRDIIVFILACVAFIVYCCAIYQMVKNNSPNTWDK